MLTELKTQFESIYQDCQAKTKNENDVQKFMEDNTELIPRVFLLNHGVNLDTAFVKVSIGGGSYKSDFMLITKSTVEARCVHIEIENPVKKPFSANGEMTSDLSHAIGQVKSWQAELAIPSAQMILADDVKKTLPIHMRDLPISHKFVLVYGRRSDLIHDKKKLWKGFNDDNFSLMTFDSLFEDDSKKLHVGKFVQKKVKIEKMNGIFSQSVFASFLNPADYMFKQSDVDLMIKKYEANRQLKRDHMQEAMKDYDASVIAGLKSIETY